MCVSSSNFKLTFWTTREILCVLYALLILSSLNGCSSAPSMNPPHPSTSLKNSIKFVPPTQESSTIESSIQSPVSQPPKPTSSSSPSVDLPSPSSAVSTHQSIKPSLKKQDFLYFPPSVYSSTSSTNSSTSTSPFSSLFHPNSCQQSHVGFLPRVGYAFLPSFDPSPSYLGASMPESRLF